MKPEYESAKIKTSQLADKLNLNHHMIYGPTTKTYWEQKIKIVAVNLEPYGYEGHRRYEVTREILNEWMFNAGKSRTVRNTMAAIDVLINGFYNRKSITDNDFKMAYSNTESLIKTLDKICYYNIRPVSNNIKNEANRGALDYTSEITDSIALELKLLNPDVYLVSGNKATLALTKLLKINPNSFINGVINHENTVIISVKHFSRPSYNQLTTVISQALQELIPIITNKS